MAIVLFEDRETDGTSESYKIIEPRGAISVSGTFDGATVTIESSIDGTIFVATEQATAASMLAFEFVKGGELRAVITSAGASTSLTVKLALEK